MALADGTPPGASTGQPPLLSGVVVHWHGEEDLARLLAAWPRDPRFELVVVNNGSAAPLPEGPFHLVEPGANLGFAGGANAGVAAARAPALLLLNPDARPEPGALEQLLEGLAAFPEAAGVVPRLVDEEGRSQLEWQLRRLPRPTELLLHALLIAPSLGPGREPAAGTAIEQPAAAALVLRRQALSAVGGLDRGYYPAWFEDVDLARRLARQGLRLRYWPAAVFRHRLGGSVPRLGYGAFLWIYGRNLCRYLARQHGEGWARAAQALLVAGMLLRTAALPLARPRRAASRREAAAGLLAVAWGALTTWRRPRSFAVRFAPGGSAGGGER
jgi:GT2 family glycosyltransferase